MEPLAGPRQRTMNPRSVEENKLHSPRHRACSPWLRNLISNVMPVFIVFATIDTAIATPPHPGPQFVDKHGCQHCHLIAGQGSSLAPPLDGISKHRGEDYIVKRLTDKSGAESDFPNELMSHVRVSPVEAKFIAEYLLGLQERPLLVQGHADVPPESPAGSHFKPLEPSGSTRRGSKIFSTAGCMACHSVGTTGGHLGPNLAGIGARKSRNYIRERIEKGALLLPKPKEPSGRYSMPPPKLTPVQKEDLTNWLLTLPPPQ